MTLTLERKIVLGFATAVAVLILALAATWWNVAQFAATYRWVGHSRGILERIEQTHSQLLHMQSATRGFVLTGGEDVLRPYHDSGDRMHEGLATLARLAADNATHREGLQRLAPLLTQARALMEERIAARRAQRHGGAEEIRAFMAGQETADAIARVLGDMAFAERKLLDERLLRADQRGQLLFAAIALVTAIAAILVLLALGRVRHELGQRKAAEEERDRFFILSRDLLCVATPDGYFKRINPAWQATLGLRADELLSRRFTDFVHPDDRARTHAETDRLVAGAESIDFENRYRAADGSYRWLHWSARFSPHERLIFASARDITERKRADEEIRALNTDLAQRAQQLEAANRELESFSYSVSHDLRAPLRHIDGFANLLARKLGAHADDDTRRFVATISRAAKRMGTLIDDLLAFSRIGRTQLRLELVDQKQLVADIIAEGHFQTSAAAVKWEIGPLPAVRADRALLRQVWSNLLDNAVKYSSKTKEPRITLGEDTQTQANGEYVFFLRDNGVGFDMTYASQLFGVFQRLHGPEEFEGTGIGLANVRRIISRHGGRTWAEGRLGEGASFYFSLPRPPAASASPQL